MAIELGIDADFHEPDFKPTTSRGFIQFPIPTESTALLARIFLPAKAINAENFSLRVYVKVQQV